MNAPMTAPVTRQAMMDSHHDQPHRDDDDRGRLVHEVGEVGGVGELVPPPPAEALTLPDTLDDLSAWMAAHLRTAGQHEVFTVVAHEPYKGYSGVPDDRHGVAP